MSARFASIVLDVDSTLCGIEGIDWLAERRSPDVAVSVADSTNRSMRGEVELQDVYADRLSLVRPTRADVSALSRAYASALAPGAEDAIARWLGSGIRVVLLTGGIRAAILPVARQLGISDRNVHAVDLMFDSDGNYVDFDRSSPLATATGKPEIARMLALPQPVLGVGDGSTDAALRGTVNAFAAFTGFVNRQLVSELANFVVTSFRELNDVVYFVPPP